MTEAGAQQHSAAIAARYEARWALVMALIIVFLLAVVVFTGLHWASMPPSRVEVIDATTLHLKGEFAEGNLGVAVDPNGHITVHLSSSCAESIDRDGILGECHPYGPERRLPAADGRQSPALWHAALRTAPG